MNFDPHSLERLRELGRKLPKELPITNNPSTKKALEKKPRHPIETETDPEALFHELIKASADGTIPPHLLARLKEAEATKKAPIFLSNTSHQANKDSQQKRSSSSKEEEDLFLSFKELLREEEEI